MSMLWNLPGSHEAVNLFWVPLDLVFDLQSLSPLLHIILWLVLAGQQQDWDSNIGRIARVNHGWMSGRSNFERCARA